MQAEDSACRAEDETAATQVRRVDRDEQHAGWWASRTCGRSGRSEGGRDTLSRPPNAEALAQRCSAKRMPGGVGHDPHSAVRR